MSVSRATQAYCWEGQGPAIPQRVRALTAGLERHAGMQPVCEVPHRSRAVQLVWLVCHKLDGLGRRSSRAGHRRGRDSSDMVRVCSLPRVFDGGTGPDGLCGRRWGRVFPLRQGRCGCWRRVGVWQTGDGSLAAILHGIGRRQHLHAAVLQGRDLLRGKGTRLASVVLPPVLEPYLNWTCMSVLFRGRQGQLRPQLGARIAHAEAWLIRTWTSFSFRDTRFTMSRRAALSGLGFAL